MLARIGHAFDLGPRAVANVRVGELRELLAARRTLVRERTACVNRQKQFTLALLKRQGAARLRQIAAVDAALYEAIAADPQLARYLVDLASMPGIGDQAAFALLIDMPKLGTIESKQAATLAGFAPRTR